MAIDVDVQLLGVLHKLAGKSTVSMKFDSSSVVVKDVIFKLVNSLSSNVKHFLIDSELDDPRPNTLILLNNKEIGALEGLKTKVEKGDKLVLVPVSHGG